MAPARRLPGVEGQGPGCALWCHHPRAPILPKDPGSEAQGAGSMGRAGVLGPQASPVPSLQSASRGSLKLAARTAAGASTVASVIRTLSTASAQPAGPGTSARAVSGWLGDPWGRPGGPSGPSGVASIVPQCGASAGWAHGSLVMSYSEQPHALGAFSPCPRSVLSVGPGLSQKAHGWR